MTASPARFPLLRAALLLGWAAGPLLAGHAPRHRPRAPKAAAKAAPDAIAGRQHLAPFLQALRALEKPGADGVVRILQFGDSHTAADYWTGQLRRRLQARFGDAGPGHVQGGLPWRGYAHEGVRLAPGPGWTARSLRNPDGDGLVGLAGAALLPPEEPTPGPAFTFRAAFAQARITVLGPETGPVEASTSPSAAGPGTPPPAREALALAASTPLGEGAFLRTFTCASPSPALPAALDLFLPPGSRFLGLDLRSGVPGVVVDELGLNGADLANLDRWNPALRRILLEQARPALVVLAYGTNEESLSAADREDYPARVRAVIQAVREASGAPVLVVGPLDRLGRARRQRPALKAGAEWVIRTLRAAALEGGCAFWDARQAMGGYGSIQKWRKAGLAQPDLVHLNGAGYQKLGNLMADRLLAGMGKP